MARVSEGSQFYLPPHVQLCILSWNEACLPLGLLPSCRALYFGRYSFPVPLRVGDWAGLAGWLQPRWFARPKTVTHPNTNRARHIVTSLMRPTLLPLRQTATVTAIMVAVVFCWRIAFVNNFICVVECMLKTFNDLKRATYGPRTDYTYVGKVHATTAILNKFVTLQGQLSQSQWRLRV